MLPSAVSIGDEYIIEDHGAQADHDEFSDAANVKTGMEPVGFEALPAGTLFIAEGEYVVAKDIAQKPQLVTFMRRVGGHCHFIVSMKQKNLTSFRMRVKLKDRKESGGNGDTAQQHQSKPDQVRLSRIETHNTANNDGGKKHRQPTQDSIAADLIPLHYDHGTSSSIQERHYIVITSVGANDATSCKIVVQSNDQDRRLR
jgi:hypothetical protein